MTDTTIDGIALPAPALPPMVPSALANALPERARTALASPAVRRAWPAILVALAVMVLASVWLLVRSPEWRPLYADLSDGDKAAVLSALQAGNYQARVNPDTGGIEVAGGDVAAARILLAGQGLPKSAHSADPVGDMPLGLSRAVEAARLQGAQALELAASIKSIDGVKGATVHVATPEPSVFVRDKAPPTASVFVTLAPGRALGEAQVRAIVWLVSTSVAGLSPDRVSVVDQSGALLSSGTSAGEAAQLGYQTRLESMVRERLFKLLTPLLGQGKFTAEVAADVDYTRNEAATERYGPDSVLRSEAASRTLDPTPPPARGIPGALSNTAPAGANLTTTPPAATAGAGAPPPATTSENTNRLWEIGKAVSVTRGDTPRLQRLSVAVVIDAAALGKNGARDLGAITRIVRGAVGFDAARGDQVEVQLRTFAPPPAEPKPNWFKSPDVRDNVPLIAGAVLALVGLIVAGILMLKARRARAAAAEASARAAAAERALAAGDVALAAAIAAGTVPTPAVVDGGELMPAPLPRLIDYSEKLGATRELVNDDADRATAVARQMLAAS
ncbi:MAG: hypothetical protein RL490_2024 [Pseudomonadota bacterium]|jgi:flagellar M-ring protein FliF